MARHSTFSSWRRPSRTRPWSIWRPAPSCGCGCRGPRTTNPTSRSSMWSRSPWPTTLNETTWRSLRQPQPPTCPGTSGRCGDANYASFSGAWWRARRGRCSGFPAPRPPTGSFGASGPRSPSSSPPGALSSFGARPTGSTWVRFGWDRDDVWLPVEDRHAARALDAARRERLSGKSLAAALGFIPQYLLVTVSPPRDGHCYKVCAAILPRG